MRNEALAGRAADEVAFRTLMSRFPTGVAVVTAVDRLGRPCGMTCSSLASVCLRPPTLLACLRTDGATNQAVRARGAFAVNILHAGGRDIAELFAMPVSDRFDRVRWTLSDGGTPWLHDGVSAVADCVVRTALPSGDHTIVVAEVRCLAVVDEADTPPLLYGLRQFGVWEDERP